MGAKPDLPSRVAPLHAELPANEIDDLACEQEGLLGFGNGRLEGTTGTTEANHIGRQDLSRGQKPGERRIDGLALTHETVQVVGFREDLLMRREEPLECFLRGLLCVECRGFGQRYWPVKAALADE